MVHATRKRQYFKVCANFNAIKYTKGTLGATHPLSSFADGNGRTAPVRSRLRLRGAQDLVKFARILNPGPLAYVAKDAIIVHPASQPEFCPGPNLLDPHCLGAASQIHDVAGILRAVSWDNNIALDAFAGPYRMIQQAVKTVPADVNGFCSYRTYAATTS